MKNLKNVVKMSVVIVKLIFQIYRKQTSCSITNGNFF